MENGIIESSSRIDCFFKSLKLLSNLSNRSPVRLYSLNVLIPLMYSTIREITPFTLFLCFAPYFFDIFPLIYIKGKANIIKAKSARPHCQLMINANSRVNALKNRTLKILDIEWVRICSKSAISVVRVEVSRPILFLLKYPKFRLRI